jgi:spermidine/putrescine-binding protein
MTDVNKLIERLEQNAGWRDERQNCVTSPTLLTEAALALTAERERADKAEADFDQQAATFDVIKTQINVLIADEEDLTRKLAEAEAWWGSPGHERTRMLAALAEAVEVVKGLLKLQLIDDDDADEDLFPEWQRARAFIQKQEAGK